MYSRTRDSGSPPCNRSVMTATDPAEALRLHNEVSALTTQLAEAEDRWCQLQEEINEE